MDLVGAIKRPFMDWKKLLIGGLMYLIPPINIITSIFGLGYILKAAVLSFSKDKTMPEWTDWGNLFLKGLLAVVITLIWSIPLFIVLGIGVGTAIAGILGNLAALQQGDFTVFTGLFAGMGILAVVLFLVWLLTNYLVPSALLNFVKEDRFGAGFAFGTVFKRAFTGKYFVAWLVGAIGTMVILFIAGLIGAIPLLGWLLSFVVMALVPFVAGIFYVTVLGEAYGDLMAEKQKVTVK
jgi:hypothetical protein